MKSILRWLKIGAGLFLFTLALAACGGGGGGGGGTSVPSDYTGATTQATLTATNTQSIVDGGWERSINGEQVGATIGNILVATLPSTTALGASPETVSPTHPAQAFRTWVLNFTSPTPQSVQPAATTSGDLPTTGSCGGSGTYTLNLDTTTGSFSGNFVFQSYCWDNVTLNGTTPFSGSIGQNNFQVKLTYSNLENNLEGVVTTLTQGFLSGTLSFDNTGTPTSETDNFDYVLIDSASQKNYWVHNFAAVSNIQNGQVTIQGRYYDYDEGYVDVSTITPLLFNDTTNPYQPTQGVLLFTGNNSQARLTFNSDGSTTIELSTGGGPFVPI
jgi:hypothetical protein